VWGRGSSIVASSFTLVSGFFCYSTMKCCKIKCDFVSYPGVMNTSDHRSTVVKFFDCQLRLFAVMNQDAALLVCTKSIS